MTTCLITVALAMLMAVGCLGGSGFVPLPEDDWVGSQDWPDCCQHSTVVRAFLCSSCSPPLQEIPANMPTDLWVIDLSFNEIPFISDNQFEYIPELQFLTLANNRIGVVQPSAFNGIDLLTNLDLENNLITDIPVGLPPSLTTLQFKGNPLSYVDDTSFADVTSLTTLSFSATEIRTDAFTGLSLTSLDMSTCHIGSNAFRGLAPNYPLDLTNPCPDYLNGDNTLILESFAFANLGGEGNAQIIIKNTSISEIPYRAFYSMGSDVSSVSLTDIHDLTEIMPEAFSDTSALESITIASADSTNQLTLYAGIISGFLPNLKNVVFSDIGEVSSVHAGIFDNLGSLVDVHLDGLGLTYIPPGVLLPLEDIASVANLNLNNNPWRCDCNLRWLKELLDRASFNWFPETLACASPPDLEGRLFDALLPTDFEC